MARNNENEPRTIPGAIKVAEQMSDRELYDRVMCGTDIWLVAAIRLGRQTPSDLGGRRSSYTVPSTLPWHPPREIRRKARLTLLCSQASKTPSR